ncbi:capsular exopolysaccharide synthesis family protein [Curtobacterium flaccumfaciens]|uniref:non-specific protein-tyrosine kinase n=1 Tax=Curtobacterium flaccumfaciens TaxID=2035 RepID=A0A4V3BKX4_9MICO|nr:polysaccharide biosynthesis tyrosine autokinase [Curtobacterium flaccumfaciens]TDN44022.1 capsular exopolysaccharide synthesis family protein [Curtobacterium flaccumfaciens]
MTLSQFLAVMRRRRWWVAALTLLGIAAAGVVTLVQTPMYRAEASVFVSVSGSVSASDLSQGGSFSEARVSSYAELATAPRVLRDAARAAGVEGSVSELERAVRATSTADTVILTIGATQATRNDAIALADAVAEELVAVVAGIERTGADGQALVQLSVYQKATAPSAPVSPRIPVNIALGLLVGIGSGIGLALLRETVDTKIRSVEILRRTADRTVLAEIPLDEDMATAPLVEMDSNYSGRAEAFRQLRTHLTFTNLDGGPQTVVVTSAVPGEGKSSTSVNLALTLAQNGHRVILIDADLRRPSTSVSLDIESRVGLSTVLTHQVELEDAVQTVGTHGLHVLSAGRVPPNPSELLGSRQMSMLLDIVRQTYDYVIIDAPPVLPVTDPTVLAGLSSGVLFVTAVDGRATTTEVGQALATLDAVGARVLGLVANRVRGQRRQSTYYGYAPSTPVSESPRRARRARDGKAGPR